MMRSLLVMLMIIGCRKDIPQGEIERRLSNYCANVRANIHLDAIQLENTQDPKRQLAASQRFMIAAQHSYGDIRLCLGEVPAEVSDSYDACYIGGDETSNYTCLARLARIVDKELRK